MSTEDELREIARYTALTLGADFGRVMMTAELLD